MAHTATARAHPNIAFIKYWGNADEKLRLPANPSISMNLDGLHTETRVSWDDSLASDMLLLNGVEESGRALHRVSLHLDVMRRWLGLTAKARVESVNNFPMGTGIASSASSFAALTLAAAAASGKPISERELTTLARLGSGSAARSIPAGFVEWHTGKAHEESYAESVAGPEHWALMDVVAILSAAHKEVGSREGHTSANSSDLQGARVAGAARRLALCKQAILERNFAALADVVELDSNLMHAVMMTSQPPLFYWLPGTLTIMDKVRRWRAAGLRVCYTLDAGPNVHCICVREDAETVRKELSGLSEVVDVRLAAPGGAAQIVAS